MRPSGNFHRLNGKEIQQLLQRQTEQSYEDCSQAEERTAQRAQGGTEVHSVSFFHMLGTSHFVRWQEDSLRKQIEKYDNLISEGRQEIVRSSEQV